MADVHNFSEYLPTATPIRVRPLESDGGGGNDGGMEARLAKVEAAVEHIHTSLSDLKSDIRDLRSEARNMLYAGVAAAGLILAALAGGFVMLNSKSDDIVKALHDAGGSGSKP